MSGWRLALTAALAGLALGSAAVAGDRYDPRALKGRIEGPPTQVMVLGTAHLSQMPDSYKTEFLAPLLDRLAGYGPQIITIESLAGPECEMLVRYKALYPGVADDYCWDPAGARAATGLEVPAAEAKAASLLAAWPASPTPAQRRELAATFMAANDRASAVVQWLRLDPAERHEGDGIDAALLAQIEKAAKSRNENIAIAATLAARLGLERVYPVDDHTADRITAGLGPDFEAAIQKVWSVPNPAMKAYQDSQASVVSGESLLAFYRFLNSEESARGSIEGDMGAAMLEPSPEHYGRQYMAWWETRNLRMVANIREAFGPRPGARVLSIVGATHKAYFESYLDMMAETRLVDPLTVLR
jgi:hypothetical protein